MVDAATTAAAAAPDVAAITTITAALAAAAVVAAAAATAAAAEERFFNNKQTFGQVLNIGSQLSRAALPMKIRYRMSEEAFFSFTAVGHWAQWTHWVHWDLLRNLVVFTRYMQYMNSG